jgi:hypothetical protein
MGCGRVIREDLIVRVVILDSGYTNRTGVISMTLDYGRTMREGFIVRVVTFDSGVMG